MHKKVLIKDETGLPVLDPRGRKLYDYRPNPVCMREIKEAECGRCSWTISEKTQYVGEAKETWLDGLSWTDIKDTAVILPAKSAAQVKAYILNQCKKTDCNKDISKWRIKIDNYP